MFRLLGRGLDKLSTLGTTCFWRRYHASWATIWVLSVPVAIVTPLKSSIIFLIFVSLMTAFSGEMAALHGVTVEEKQDG